MAGVGADGQAVHGDGADRLGVGQRGALPRTGCSARCASIGGTAALDDYGNLIATFPATGSTATEPILLSCHADTVKPGVGIEPVLGEDGIIRSKGDTILGADDKAGIAEVLEALRVAPVRPPIELAV